MDHHSVGQGRSPRRRDQSRRAVLALSERTPDVAVDSGPTVVGIAALAHDAAACVVRNGHILAAAEEERFTRRKHHGGLPVHALRWCLEAADLDLSGVDAVAVGIDPTLLADRRATFDDLGSYRVDEAHVRRMLGIKAPIHFVRHHLAHAASAFDCSPFDEAAVLVVDGVGEWDTTTIWHGGANGLAEIESIEFPHSLGLFYAAITEWLGFRANNDEYKVMGLASYGTVSTLGVERIGELVPVDDGWCFRLAPAVTAMALGTPGADDELGAVLGRRRSPHEPLRQMHADLAATAQRVLEDRLVALARHARERTGSAHLCTAGGVMLNAVANRQVRERAGFDNVWFQPVAGDAGIALGAASVVARELAGTGVEPLTSLALGPPPAPSSDRVIAMLDAAEVSFHDFGADVAGMTALVAALIAEGAVVGWCDGPSEFGPRALGRRSIIADPRRIESRDRINAGVKERESWRPLAPMVAADAAPDLFALGDTGSTHGHRFMIEVAATIDDRLPAATHVDGTARPQLVDADREPRLVALLDAVAQRTGVPAVVNTSFNHASEPIVATAEHALVTAVRCGLDALVIGDIVVTELPEISGALLEPWCAPDSATPTADQLYPL